jgi:hypothetical protein
VSEQRRWKVGAAPFQPTAPTSGDASEAIWQDPSSYNPYMQGPPYLPGLPYEGRVARVASAQEIESVVLEAPNTALPAILTLLRALAMVHQSHHWLTYGPAFYGDHLLFERLYDDIGDEIDKVAERAVGSGASKTALHPGAQALQIARVVEALCGNGVTFGEGENPDSYVSTSLRAERWFLGCVKQLAASLDAVDQLSRGTDNLLQGIEDKHEEHVYLLLQRTGGDQAMPKTAADWKAAADPWKVKAQDGETEEAKMQKAFLDWIDDVIKKGEAAKKEIKKADDPGRAAAEFVGTVVRIRGEDWHDFFYR